MWQKCCQVNLIIFGRIAKQKASNQKILCFPLYLTSASALPGDRGNREIAVFQLTVHAVLPTNTQSILEKQESLRRSELFIVTGQVATLNCAPGAQVCCRRGCGPSGSACGHRATVWRFVSMKNLAKLRPNSITLSWSQTWSQTCSELECGLSRTI